MSQNQMMCPECTALDKFFVSKCGDIYCRTCGNTGTTNAWAVAFVNRDKVVADQYKKLGDEIIKHGEAL